MVCIRLYDNSKSCNCFKPWNGRPFKSSIKLLDKSLEFRKEMEIYSLNKRIKRKTYNSLNSRQLAKMGMFCMELVFSSL